MGDVFRLPKPSSRNSAIFEQFFFPQDKNVKLVEKGLDVSLKTNYVERGILEVPLVQQVNGLKREERISLRRTVKALVISMVDFRNISH